jgi:hypothetical protein
MTRWLHDVRNDGPDLHALFAQVATSIIVDEMTEADGGCVDDFYHSITLLAAMRSAFYRADIDAALATRDAVA